MKTRRYSQDDINAWNWAHPVGSDCIMISDPITIGTVGFRTRTRSSAWLLPSGYAVVCLEGRTGSHSVDYVLFVMSEEVPTQPVEDVKYPGVGGSKHLPGTTIPPEDSVAGMQLIAHIPSC